jgi:xanthine dehydrogenase YagR molybdenum-binding subunit
VSTAATDLGTGTWTILSQVAADAFGLPLEAVTAHIGDSELPISPVAGGSWTAASSGSSIQAACEAVKQTLFKHAKNMTNSPLRDADFDQIEVSAGRIARRDDPGRSLSIVEVMHAADLTEIEESGQAAPDSKQMRTHVSYTHSAVFAEVRVDEELGVVRVTRIVCAAAAGRILNPKTARSQILGGVVMGIGMALHEEAMIDHRLGKIMNHNLAEYHVPAHADIHDIEVIFVDEPDDKVNPLGVKGLGEIGVVGTAAAVANAVSMRRQSACGTSRSRWISCCFTRVIKFKQFQEALLAQREVLAQWARARPGQVATAAVQNRVRVRQVRRVA